ncbi:hypothetical protein AeMF1_011440 [Aphanomyces euteiches]|nr:hypothetical protein AeMF1_011440 [Aphanomyces euteiches]
MRHKSNSCLDIMMKLNVEDLEEIKKDFEKLDGGVNLDSFVSILLDRLPRVESTAVEVVYELIDVFAHVVTNGQGTMGWEDFTAALIEAGMTNGLEASQWSDVRYEENVLYVDRTSRQPKEVLYIPELRRLFVFESSRPVIQVYDPSAILASEVAESLDDLNNAPSALPMTHEIHPLSFMPGYRRDQDAVRSEHSPVQAIKYLSTLDIVAISAGDLKLSFWNCAIMLTSEIPAPLEIVPTEHPQRVLEWAPRASRLFTISMDNFILVWTILAKGSKKCTATCTNILDKHRDIVQDLLLVNDETLVSCGMDALILVWDPNTLECKSTRQAHKAGIRILAKHSSTVFISAGFEMDMLGWDVSGLSLAPIFKLCGHNAPVVAIHVAQGYDQAVSLDEDGWFKWWNLQNLISTEDSDRCLQTFRFGNEKYPWKPSGFTIFNNGATLLACGFRLKWIQRVRLKPRAVASNAMLYSDHSFTVLTTTDKEIQIWDAIDGRLIQSFRDVSRTDITQVEFDALERKVIVANQGGELLVYNAANGSLVKSFDRHLSQVSCLHYCREDECLLTASWDKSLRVYDDRPPNTLLRCISDAHDSDIKCLAYSHSLSLVATGSSDGHIKIWDYIFFLLDQEHPCASEVNCLAFLEPYPILISGHENGAVLMFTVRPHSNPGQIVCSFSISPVCVMQTFFDESGGAELVEGVAQGQHLLILGDQIGHVRSYDLTKVLHSRGIETVAENLLPTHSETYNPRRRILREGKHANRTTDRPRSRSSVDYAPSPAMVDVDLVAEWTAHTMAIRSMCVVDEPKCIFTCSHDKSTKVWSFAGECLGILCGDKEQQLFWRLSVDTDAVSDRKLQFAQALWESLKPQKLARQPIRRSLSKHLSMPLLVEEPCQDISRMSEKERLFGQLRGATTWKKPEIQLARERAWEIEAAKYKTRMEKIFKVKPREESVKVAAIDSLEMEATKNANTRSMTTLPQLNSSQLTQVPYDDKDNWKINSLNRQKMIYNHLYTETCRTAKQFQGKRQPKLLLQTIDTSPSAFLLEKLGPDEKSLPIRRQRKQSKAALAASKSLPILRKGSQKDLCAPKRLPELPKNQQLDQIENIINHATKVGSADTPATSSPSANLMPRRLQRSASVLRYEKIMEEPDEVSKPAKPLLKKRQATSKELHAHQSSKSSLALEKAKSGIPETTKEQIHADQALLAQKTFGPYTRESVYEACKLFADIDKDDSGSIETQEFVEKLVRIQGDEMKPALEELFRRMDHDGNGLIDMTEMLKAVFPKANARVREEMIAYSRLALYAAFASKSERKELSKEALDDLTHLFQMFDKDNSGSVDVNELIQGLRANEESGEDGGDNESNNSTGRVTSHDVERLFRQYNTKGSLQLPEFIALLGDFFE